MAQDLEARAAIEALKAKVEAIIEQNKCDDAELQQALIEVGRDRLWRQGLWTRIRYWVNVFGALGVLGGGAFWLLTVLGYDLVRR